MDPQLWLQVGFGGAALFILREVLKRNDERIDSRDRAFIKFAAEHNDAMADLVKESTEAIKGAGEAIKEHTELLKRIK